MRLTKSFTKSDYSSVDNVIIYGAGRYGELAYWGCKALGVDPYCFADQNNAGKEYLSLNTILPENICKIKNPIVLIASYNYFYEILANVQSMGIEKYYDIEKLILIDYNEDVLSEYVVDEKHNIYKYRNVIENAGSDKLVLNHVDVVITECCTLKCRDCANLMQYYKYPEVFNIKNIMLYFDKLLDSIDLLLEMRILGGEPFIHKKIADLLSYYLNNDKIERITIYTNSTLLPNDETLEVMKHEKIGVHMSNYGYVSKKLSELDQVLTEHGINHYIHNYDKWHDLGGLNKRHFSEQTLMSMYKTCIMAKCLSFYRGRLYTCPRAGNGERIGAFINYEHEYVDFTNNSNVNEQRMKICQL
ncbi:MAG: radical SAM protein, partial [Lachnospiraceae bacterium]|nr:radical SAM protein [Lachnospiraceae bacterium]